MIQCDLLKEVIFAEGTGGGRDSNFCQELLELSHTQRKSHDSNNQYTLMTFQEQIPWVQATRGTRVEGVKMQKHDFRQS